MFLDVSFDIKNLLSLKYDKIVSHVDQPLLVWEPIIWSTKSLTVFLEQNVINLTTLILLGYLIFFLGFFGLLLYKGSLIFCLISIELLLVGINFAIIFLGAFLEYTFSQVLVFIFLTLAAAETAIGLTLILLYYKVYATTSLHLLNAYAL